MLSRVACATYWLNRYLERADNVARFITVNMHLLLDLRQGSEEMQWSPLIATSGDVQDFNKRYHDYNERNVIQFLTFDEQNSNSIVSCIQKARENARAIRNDLPAEMWEYINEMYHLVQKHNRKGSITDLQGFYAMIKNACHLLTGLMENTMLRDDGWYFSYLGRMIERADKTGRILDVKYFLLLPEKELPDSPYDNIQWGAVLKSINGFEMYRRKFHRVQAADVVEFMLFDPTFPRSVAFCLQQARHCLANIVNTEAFDQQKSTLEAIDNLCQSVITQEQSEVKLAVCGLHGFIDNLQSGLNAIDSQIFSAFFNMPFPQQEMQMAH